jgi:hypothetical protein
VDHESAGLWARARTACTASIRTRALVIALHCARCMKHLAILVLSVSACATDATVDISPLTGNGAPSGTHYDLNIIGVAKGKSPNMTGGDGHRIFVPLTGTAKINLSEGDFAVLDANGTDGTAAFELPNPDPDGDGVTSYSVFARALGKPGGSSITTTCATDPVTGDTVCSDQSMVLVRDQGGSKFTNVSKSLLYVIADLDGDGTVEKVPLFSDTLQDYFWNYDNTGLRLAQLRFYQVATNTN